MFLKNEFLKILTSQIKDKKMATKNKLQIAQTLLGKNIKPLVLNYDSNNQYEKQEDKFKNIISMKLQIWFMF